MPVIEGELHLKHKIYEEKIIMIGANREVMYLTWKAAFRMSSDFA